MSDRPDQPHDKFFKDTFSDVANTAPQLRSILAPKVERLLKWSSLRLESGSMEKTKTSNRFCDLLFSVDRADDDGEVLVYVLFEHLCGAPHKCSYAAPRVMRRRWRRSAHVESFSSG